MLNNWMYWHTDTHKAQRSGVLFPLFATRGSFFTLVFVLSFHMHRQTHTDVRGRQCYKVLNAISMLTHSKNSISGTDTLAVRVSATHLRCLRILKCQLSQMVRRCEYISIPAHSYSAWYILKQRGEDGEIIPPATDEDYAEYGCI